MGAAARVRRHDAVRGTVRYPLWEVTEVAEAIVRCGEDLDAG
ncbi:hypothetical protein [Actinomadura napierensis]